MRSNVWEINVLIESEIICTSINIDDMKNGYDFQLMKALAGSVSIPIVASGDAGTLQHISEVFLEGKSDAALVIMSFQLKTLKSIESLKI